MSATVAVCIPAYRPNHTYLQRLLESVAGQTQQPSEAIVHIDPADGGNPTDKLDGIQATLPYLQVISAKGRLGMAANWNAAVRASSAEYVIVPGQDDLLHPVAIETHMTSISSRGGAISCSNRFYIGSDGAVRESNQRSVQADRIFEAGRLYKIPAHIAIELSLAYGNVLGEPCGTLFSRELFDEVGGFDASLRHGADIDFTLRAARVAGHVLYNTRRLSYFRLHDSNATHTNIREGHSAQDRQRLLQLHSTEVGASVLERAEARVRTHEIYDQLRNRRILGTLRSLVARPFPRMKAVVAEAHELFGGAPAGREWITGCESWPQ